MNDTAWQALALTATARVERLESKLFQRESEQDEQSAEQLEEKLKLLLKQADAEDQEAEEDFTKSEKLAETAAAEAKEASIKEKQFSQDEELRLALLKNITADMVRKDELQKELKEVHDGFCGWTIIDKVCDIVSKTVELRNEIDKEQIKIQEEWDQEEALKSNEFLEAKIAYLDYSEASKYNRTAAKLKHLAKEWKARAKRDHDVAARDNSTALDLESLSQQELTEASEMIERQKRDMIASRTLWLKAAGDYRASYRWSLLALALSTTSLLFFVYSATKRLIPVIGDLFKWSCDSRSSPRDVVRCWSSMLQHILVFLLTVGFVGDKYLINIESYSDAQRAVIVAWFSFCAAGLQSVALQAIPHVLNEWPLTDMTSLRVIGICFLWRTLTLMALFGMEVLLVLLEARGLLLNAETVAYYESLGFRLLCFSSLALHVVYLEPPDSIFFSQGQSTLAEGEEMSELLPSESSTLVTGVCVADSSHMSASGAFDIKNSTHLFGGQPHSRFGVSNVGTREILVPYTVRIWDDVTLLLLASDLLLSACMVSVLSDCIAVGWSHTVTAVITLLLVGFSVPTLLLASLWKWVLVPSNRPMQRHDPFY